MDLPFLILLLAGGVIGLASVVVGLLLLAKRLAGSTEIELQHFGKIKTSQNGALGLFFGAFFFTYSIVAYGHMTSSASKPDYDLWRVDGTINGLGDAIPTIAIQPPDQHISQDGVFTIEKVPFPHQGETPADLLVELNGYKPIIVHLTGEHAKDYNVSLDYHAKRITIGRQLPLEKLQPYNPASGQIPRSVAP